MGDVVYYPRCNVTVEIDEDLKIRDLATVPIACLRFAQNVVTTGITCNHVLRMNQTLMKKTVQKNNYSASRDKN